VSARRAIRDDLVGFKFPTNNGFCTVDKYVTYSEVHATFDDTRHSTITTLQRLKNGTVYDPFAKNFSGVGYIGIGEYKTMVDGKRPPYYIRWSGMISRCYAEAGRKANPSYKDSLMREKWHCLQNFGGWYDNHPHRNDSWEIDKDILIKGNKIYSEETCIFVPKQINTLFTKCNSWRGDLPIGVHQVGKTECYKMACGDGTPKRIVISGFKTPEDAFYAYKETKESVIRRHAEKYKIDLEPRAYEALLNYQVEITD